ncbi:amylo-alpha-1,6-glucosidase [Acidisarcina polymorpha]|nr:GH116 family glycosyl hydrolase [Acidisarcina polymorpha]
MKYAAMLLALTTLIVSAEALAQPQHGELDWLKPLPQFPLASSGLNIHQHAESGKPFTVAGQCGAFMGEQNGSFEAWIFPVKLLSHFTIAASVEGYPVPIDLNADAAEIDVAPDHTTITYSHIAFTVREILFATRCTSAADAGAGVIALFQIDAVRPVTLTFSFTPEVRRMWPAPNYGPPSPEWVGTATSGYYLLHEDFPDLAGAIAMPGTRPGILAPFQEKPKTYPLQLILDFDPKRDAGKYFPLTMAIGTTSQTANKAALAERLARLNTDAKQLYSKTADYYAHFFDKKLTVETPDKLLDEALKWAEISIDQVQVRHGDEVGLVAGFYSSGDSARPGFGWYFGRDTLYTLYAVNSYGDFALTREALDFLLKRQREDGKMPHEWSQTADLVDWKRFPYEYAAADATPLFLMAMEDYVDASGDVDYLRKNWPAIQKAWDFERTHDSDGDGIYDNSQGTGWVENWDPFPMPHQEIYLAALDQQASGAMSRMSKKLGDSSIAQAAEARAASVAAKIEQEYAGSMYAFSYNGNGSLDKTASLYPAIAWWDGHYALKQPDAMFRRWDSHEFSTDWGTRDVGEHEQIYDPISYHQGSVWPLFTGWASIAEYRTGRPLSGYAHLMQNAELTWQQDLGAVTELLSGAYFVPFGRSTSHQMWSSAMVIIPSVRGLFGITRDADDKRLIVDPRLPAEWTDATLRNLAVGTQLVDLRLKRQGDSLVVSMSQSSPQILLESKAGVKAIAKAGGAAELKIALPAVEVGIPAGLPLPGSVTSQLKVLSESYGTRSLTLELEAQAGSSFDLPLRLNAKTAKAAAEPRAERATILANPDSSELRSLHIVFPSGEGYQQATVRLSW